MAEPKVIAPKRGDRFWQLQLCYDGIFEVVAVNSLRWKQARQSSNHLSSTTLWTAPLLYCSVSVHRRIEKMRFGWAGAPRRQVLPHRAPIHATRGYLLAFATYCAFGTQAHLASPRSAAKLK